MLNSKLNLTLSLAALAAMTALAQGQPTPTAASAGGPPPPSAWDQWVKQVKNPCSYISWGFDLRFRNEYLDNAVTLNQGAARHDQDYFRFRERLWFSVMPVTNLSVNARVAAEQREWMRPSYASQYGTRSGLEERYGILDTANIKWNNAFGIPLSITSGRQDIMLGDPLNWWLVCDGTPGDGSWTMFFDSIRLGYDAKEIKTKFDLIYLYQNALPDEWIPTIGRSSTSLLENGTVKPYYLTEQNEQGVILYASNKSIKNTQVDGYFIYKRDSQENAIMSPYKTPLGDNADIYTIGAKVTGTPGDHWKYSAEGAYQFGHKEDPMVRTPVNVSSLNREISAFGFNGNLTYLFKDRLNNQASLVFEYLSGDNPNTQGTDEMFDILWGRWPRWSELYIYSFANETGGKIAQLNNIMRIGGSWGFKPTKNTTFTTTYNALFAPEEVPTRQFTSQSAQFSQNGNFRGHYFQAVLKHQFTKQISGHLWSECVWMGDYYTQKDVMTFIRAELMFAF